jgi:hypothetical protein
MYMPQSPDAYSHTYQPSRSNDLYKNSFYPTLKRQQIDDEQIVESDLSENIKRRSSLSIKMQQPTTNSSSNESPIGVASRLCSVCGDISTGIHFGGNSCESCKAFFRRSVQCNRYQNYKCSNEERCPVNLVTRKVCQFCRYKKCTVIGMKPKWVLSDQEREEKYGSRRKRFRQNHRTEEDPDIYKYLTKDEKLLIEDVTHALYQSRATYPLQFPNQLNQYLKLLASGVAPPTPPSSTGTSEKPPNPSANFLIVPIQRLVLFARMLKDFDAFSEDDKVNLLKGSAIEVIVWSSNTLFNPKTHTFTNYISRDQRAVMDEQIIPLDPLLIKLWGDELFNRTKTFLIAMCHLHVDEVTSTLLVPVILFSPDRSNIKDLDLVKRLQIKYVTLLQKYMNWRYGIEQTENIYPKLLLQIINIRALSLGHAEIIQKVMSTTSVDPLVKEVTVKQEVLNTSTTEKMNSLSISSTPSDSSRMDYDKTPSTDTESTIGSDEDESNRKKLRSSIEDDEDSNETNLRNIWKKRRKLSTIMQTEITNIEQNNPSPSHHDPYQQNKQELLRSNSIEYEKYLNQNYLQRKPHDHQVPNFAPTFQDDLIMPNRSPSSRHLPPKKQSLLTNRDDLHEQIHRTHSSSTNDLPSYDHYLQSNQNANSPISPASNQYYHDNYRQQYSKMPPTTFQQQQQNDQHLIRLSLEKNSSQTPPIQSHPVTSLDADEQQLLDAIHAHPNKRDLVLNLLRQMNESSPTNSSIHSNHHIQQQQQHRTDSSSNYDPYRHHTKMDCNDDVF